ncbi:MAG TPA: methylmalonyl-CoA mutase family protein [Terriglobales bacterium]|nr:methylmalonyl-CoA mutase family protein [Terriglobales bacterium]
MRPEPPPISGPGEYPYTRGIRRDMYRGRLWTMRQYAGFGDAATSNQRYKYLLSQGTTGLSIAFDLPTQLGLDSDAALARGEVGRVGVAIDSISDMQQLLEGLPLGTVSASMTINATAATLLALYIAVARRQGVSPRGLRGTVQNDILKEYIARGTYIYPPGPSLRLTTDIIAYTAREMPEWNPISISGYHLREAGCTAAQEIAFTLGNGAAYVQAALERGLDVDAFAPHLSFFFNAHNHVLEEAAKFRAARRLWARRMRERFQARDPKSWMLRFHAQTAGSTLTVEQPHLNLVRTAYQALAAVLGGAQSLHTNSFDEALGLPSENAARLALRTQQMLALETGVAATADPLGGSVYIEKLTDDLEAEAEAYLERIESWGGPRHSLLDGMLHAIETGYIQREIQDAAYRTQQAVESGAEVVVGVNRFRQEEPTAPAAPQVIDPSLEAGQIARLEAMRARRDRVRCQAALDQVASMASRAAAGDNNLMPPLIAAVEAEATVGEIADVLRREWGEHRETVVV